MSLMETESSKQRVSNTEKYNLRSSPHRSINMSWVRWNMPVIPALGYSSWRIASLRPTWLHNETLSQNNTNKKGKTTKIIN
jgi:hypothetical protein